MTDHNNLNYKEKLEVNSINYLPNLSVDCVIFGFHDGILKILLNRFKDNLKWMLPGGFIFLTENVDDAAYRILSERTSLNKIYLRQFHLFGNINRVAPDDNTQIIKKNTDTEDLNSLHWLSKRFVSVGYYSFVDYSLVNIQAEESEYVEWFHINEIPSLYGDHNHIIDKAIQTIRSQVDTIPFGHELLPEKFTMTDLRIIYETILDRKLDRRNFQRKMLASSFVIKLHEVAKKWGCKSTTLFSFDKEKYNEALTNGMAYSEW